jgi:hypothetical protein
VTDDFTLPSGFGFRRVGTAELVERANPLDPAPMDVLLIFEPPRRRPLQREYRYIMGVDVADGVGKDRSICAVSRVGTIEEPAEEVAIYVSDSIPPSQFAFIVDAIGHLYLDHEGLEACAAIECNNHGLSVQDTLQLHLGYTHFYTWEYYDAKSPGKRMSTKIGWVTTPRTRPLLLDKFYAAVTTLDPVTGKPDYIVNSPWTLSELPDFQTETFLGEAEAAAGAHDDCIMANAIANYVAWRQAGGEQEPLGERRRRRSEEQAARAHDALLRSRGRDYRNTAITADEVGAGVGLGLEDDDYDTFG